MNPTIIQMERLQKLADHLMVCKQPEYDLAPDTEENEIERGVYERSLSSHHRQVLEECLHVFPGEWVSNSEDQPIWVEDFESRTSVGSAIMFFGFSTGSFFHVFVCGMQNTILYGGEVLHAKATFRDIAMNIRCFLKRIAEEKESYEE